ncbi:hypothetical protein LINPERHAP2_LOCUS37017, partial [Linum perenne]
SLFFSSSSSSLRLNWEIDLGTESGPVFGQGTYQVTTFRTGLKGGRILLTGAVQQSLRGVASFKMILFFIRLVKIK